MRIDMDFWNERFSQREYAYGTEASPFLQRELRTIEAGKILFPGEGEGRNALFAALASFEVHAFDGSEEGRKKALELAAQSGIHYPYSITSYQEFQTQDQFDCIAMIYCHMPRTEQKAFHLKMLEALKPGGKLILEGFEKAQLGLSSGGPKDLDWLYSEPNLREDFESLTDLVIETSEELLDEGPYHRGKAKMVRLTGIKQ